MSNESLNLELERLLSASAEGDQQAFKRLYDLIHRRVFHYLVRLLGDPTPAEDVLVETFTAVWNNAEKFAGRSSVTTWVFGIARNLGLNEIRRRRPHDPLEDHPNLEGGPVPDMESGEQRKILHLAMENISAKHREILDLAFLQELTYPEIAELIDIPVGTVKTRVFHAKAALKKALSRMKVTRDDL